MRALLLSDQLSFSDGVSTPTPSIGEALVQVSQAGICNTDLELVRGYMGFAGIPGHEFVGRLVEVPPGLCDESGQPLTVGCRVVAEINCSPPGGPQLPALRAHDPKRTTLGIFRRNGAFAEYLTVPSQNLHRVPDSVSDDQAIFVEPLAAALQILEQVKLAPTDRVAVLGDGKLGLLCSQVLAQGSAAVVWAIGKHPSKLALLDGHGGRGVTTCLLGDVEARVPELFDTVVDCTGSPAGLERAISLLRPRGTLVLKSTYAPPSLGEDPARLRQAQTQLQQALTKVVIDEISVMGSRCGPFGAALRMLSEGRVRVEPLIHSRYRLADGVAAFRAAAEPGVLKVVLTP